MGIFLALTVAMALWVVLWAVGIKAFDGFMLFMAILLIAAIGRVITPHLPGNRHGDY